MKTLLILAAFAAALGVVIQSLPTRRWVKLSLLGAAALGFGLGIAHGVEVSHACP